MTTEALDRFATCARSYCAWVESPVGEPRDDLTAAHEYLAELYALAIRLPDQPRRPPESNVRITLDDATRDRAARRFHALQLQRYGRVLAPSTPPPPHADIGSLADDLFDTYRDVKMGLHYYEAGDFASAQWQWRFSWCIGWGTHAPSALSAIHSYRLSMEYREG